MFPIGRSLAEPPKARRTRAPSAEKQEESSIRMRGGTSLLARKERETFSSTYLQHMGGEGELPILCEEFYRRQGGGL